MKPSITILFVFVVHASLAQTTKTQQSTLNSYVDYANQSAKEVTLVVESVRQYYDDFSRERSWNIPRFKCPVQPDTYFLEKARTADKGINNATIQHSFQDLVDHASAIDRACKELDTYYQLQDYKNDNHARADTIVHTMPGLLQKYQDAQRKLSHALVLAYNKIAGSPATNYHRAETLMRQQILAEEKVLDLFKVNLVEKNFTGWNSDSLLTSVNQSRNALQQLKKEKLQLKYPASTMWTSFLESFTTYVNEKGRAVDEFNFAAKQSDRYSNNAYLNLLNYFNGTLVSNLNTFVEFAARDGFYGLKAINYVPAFEIRTTVIGVKPEIIPFVNTPFTVPDPQKSSQALSAETFHALEQYVAFIDETWRSVDYLQLVLKNFNSTASRYRTLESYERYGKLNFDFQKYQIPYAYLQKALFFGTHIPENINKNFSTEANVILDMLKEMEAHAAAIDISVKERQYESDHLDKIYVHLERLQLLCELWNDRKEKLYHNILSYYQSFASVGPEGSWKTSGDQLYKLFSLDYQLLMAARSYYQGDTTVHFPYEETEQTIRTVISNEHENMKGIERLGRYNGNCPYTPYEDLPATSRIFNEKLKKIKTLKATYTRQPYDEIVNTYNDIVDDYNLFSELSKDVMLLKQIHQPELFALSYPEKPIEIAQRNKGSQTSLKQKPLQTTDRSLNQSQTLIRDTIYIEKRDTVYLTEPEGDLRSMEGYATNNLVLLLDVSGSMNTPEKLPVLKQSVLNLISMMRPEDQLSIVAFSGKARVLLKPVSFKNESKIKKAISQLASSGKTDAAAGLKLGFKIADENYIRGGNNRIILATDGEFQLSDELRKVVTTAVQNDIRLSVFNFGKTTSAKQNLQMLAELGNGNYEYISPQNVENKLIKEVKGKRKK